MKPANKEELEGAFLEVRKAYRLLYSYQRRVLDTVRYIVDSLGINIQSGWALFTYNPPRNGKRIELNRSAWDWLTFYMYEFYCTEKTVGADVYRFAIIIQSDTGSYDTWSDETIVESFGTVESSKTNLVFILAKNRWKGESGKNDELYLDFHEIPSLKANQEREFVEKNENELFLLKTYPLSDFIDEESIKVQIGDFKDFIKRNGSEDIFEI